MENIRVLEILRDKNFRNLWTSQLLSQTFLNVLIFSQLLHVYDLTKSNIAVSILVLTIGVPNLILGALAGVFVDRWDKKIVMFFSQFIRVFAVLLFIVSPGSVLWIYALMLVISGVTQFWAPAEVSTIPTIIKGNLLLTANSVFTLTFFSTVILGNILAGPFLALLGPHGTYLVVALAFLAASGFVIKLPGLSIAAWLKETLGQIRNGSFKPTGGNHIGFELKKEFIEGLKFIKEHRNISQSIFYLAMSQTLIASLSVIAPGFADRVMHVQSVDVSILVMLPAALGMVIGALVLGQFFVKSNKFTLIRFGIVASGVILMVFSRVDLLASTFSQPATLVGFWILILLGAGNAFLDVPANTLLQEGTNERIRSRVYGVLTAIVGAASVFPIILAGTLSDILGVQVVMFGMGTGILLIALYNRRPR